jgi:hypothetical protein
MAACPNCGRRTQRTKDWVCEWCGYPLLYGSYKQIDKTFKELQEERSPSGRSVQPEPEYNFEEEEEPEPEPEPKSEPLWKMKKAPKPTYQMKPEPEKEITPEPQPPPRPRFEPTPKPQPQPAPLPKPESLLQPKTGPVLLPKPEPAPQPSPRSEAPLRLEPRPPQPEPKEEPVTVPSLESIKDGTQLTIDQIDALFRADNIGTNEALKDKTLIIKGFVNKVFIRDHLDIRYLILTGARKVIWSARCQFEKESVGPMSRLSEGQAVVLRGKYDGYGKNIIFKNCTPLSG